MGSPAIASARLGTGPLPAARTTPCRSTNLTGSNVPTAATLPLRCEVRKRLRHVRHHRARLIHKQRLHPPLSRWPALIHCAAPFLEAACAPCCSPCSVSPAPLAPSPSTKSSPGISPPAAA